MGLGDDHDKSFVESLGLPDYEVAPEALLLDTVVGSELCEVVFNKVLEEGDDELGIFADDGDVSGTFDSDRLILITALVEANHNFLVEIVADGKLALAPVSISAAVALDELVQLELLKLLVLLGCPHHLVVLEKLPIVILDNSVDLLNLGCDLLLIRQAMQGRYDIFNLCVPDFLPLFLSGLNFLLLCSALTFLYGDEILLGKLHPFLWQLGLDPFVLGKLAIELVDLNRLC